MNATSSASVFIKVLFMASIIFVFLILHVWVRMQFVTESFKLSSLREEIKVLDSTKAEKQIEFDKLFKPENLENLNIIENHGLKSPDKNQVVDFHAEEYDL